MRKNPTRPSPLCPMSVLFVCISQKQTPLPDHHHDYVHDYDHDYEHDYGHAAVDYHDHDNCEVDVNHMASTLYYLQSMIINHHYHD